MPADTTIVRASIHPAIGIARVGNSRQPDGFFLGPEVPGQPALAAGGYKDPQGALKRQAARFRIFGFNANGEVVTELTPKNSEITWTVHLVNKKAAWYQFQLALDLPEASNPGTPPSARRNAFETDRKKLIIDPGSRTIEGRNTQGSQYLFEGGKFYQFDVPLGELRTDDDGRLIVLGGFGLSQSKDGTPPHTFANNEGWHDDTSDGPVDAIVKIDGQEIPVDGAWVVVGPPNYAPALKTVRTFYDLLYDRMIKWGVLPTPTIVSFQRHIRPIFERLSGLQWVNQGFASWFGASAPFDVAELVSRLADKSPGNKEFRDRIYRQFRNPQTANRNLGDELWPPFYGDALDSLVAPSPQNPNPSQSVPYGLASLSELQLDQLRLWSLGRFESDATTPPPRSLAEVALPDQPAALDEAALTFCLADAFHPGCELTWSMRWPQLYRGPFRIKRRAPGQPEDFGPVLMPSVAVAADGPLNGASPGDLTKWMAVPWQTDTASCLSGYSFFRTSPSLPTFWPARVPNHVLRDREYQTIMASGNLSDRIEAFRSRFDWFRVFQGDGRSDINQMIDDFHQLGVVEERPGPQGVPGIPESLWVESIPGLPDPTAGPQPAGLALDKAIQQTKFSGKQLRQPGRYGETPQ